MNVITKDNGIQLSENNVNIRTTLQSLKISMEAKDPFLQNIWDDRANVEHGNKLRTYRLFKYGVVTEQYVKNYMPRHHRSVLAKLRSGSLQLCIETGRRNNIPLEDRTCKLCDSGQVEDEMHFAIQCPHYNLLRQDFYEQVRVSAPYIDTASNNHVLLFISIMHTSSLQRQWAAVLHKMFLKRDFDLARLE